VSETQLDSAATGATEPDAEAGEADDVSDYSEESEEAADDVLDAEAAEVAEVSEAIEEAASEEESANSALDDFKLELRLLPGAWYVVHSYAGYENRVKTNLESRIQSLNMEDFIYQIEVPVHMVTEIKGGKRQQVSEKVLPGYILVRMELTDESWAVVRNTQKNSK